MVPYLDKDFLIALDQYHHKTIYAKIIALNNNEEPIEQFEGVVTGGSITVDGSSSVRRSCNLTLTTENLHINNVYWGLSTKVIIEIGLENRINPIYDNIIWFKQGIYVLTDFKTQHQVNNYTITLNGKDKMCLLNGDLGGTFNAETDLGTRYKENAEHDIIEYKVSISNIITEMIHHYAKEKFANIIIKDLDEFGLQLLENKTDTVLYLLYTTNNIQNQGINNFAKLIYDSSNNVDELRCSSCPAIEHFADIEQHLDELIFYSTIEEDDLTLINTTVNYSEFNFNNDKYYIQRIAYGDTIGYKPMDLIYPDDLIASIGDSITSILDKIIKVFGDFEYFYNLDGQFVFQKKQTYINTSWNNIITSNDETYINPALLSSKIAYSFDNNSLITSFANNPQLNHIKNDYTVWGKKRASSGIETPIHARYAIDQKPYLYCAMDDDDITKPGMVYCTKEFYNEYIYSTIAKTYTAKLATKKRPPEWLLNATYYDYNKFIEAGGNIVTDDMIIHYTEDELNEMWWTVLDWGNCYKDLTNDTPKLRLMEYGTSPCCATIHFPKETEPRFLRSQLIFDVDRDTGEPHKGQTNINGRTQSTWSPFQHGFNGCGHSFEFFMDLDTNNPIDSWIFCPQVPQKEQDKLLNKGAGVLQVDWREIIFQMARDYYHYYLADNFLTQLIKNNVFFDDLTLYPSGQTGYEQYYHDIQGFWRLLYLGDNNISEDTNLANYYPKNHEHYARWNKNVINAPAELLFWFDFFDSTQSQIAAFSVPAIGDRAKNISEDKIRAIIYNDTPDIVFLDETETGLIPSISDKYKIITLADASMVLSKMSISSRGQSIHDQIDSMLYNYSFFNNSITLNCLPIYHLEPNTIISVDDQLSNIHGYFTLNKFTIPLTYNGTMSITAIEIPQKIY